ncbi:MAG TPA: potassium channel family protein [Solirubrobacteraceae bacterium]|nr:potassium channel family protein [Solirubrobacteraceae bacterium]
MTWHRRHRRALLTLAVAVALDIAAGFAFAAVEHVGAGIGLYWALTTATTVGYGDVAPRGTAGHLIAAVAMLTVVPLFAATFSLLTSGLTAEHVRNEGHEVRRRLDHIIRLHEDR